MGGLLLGVGVGPSGSAKSRFARNGRHPKTVVSYCHALRIGIRRAKALHKRSVIAGGDYGNL